MGKPYNDFNSFLREKFGCRVQKITLDAGFSCPNRDGTLSEQGCAFCDGKGSGSGAFANGRSIAAQVAEGKKRLGKRYGAKKFISYFQAFTNTYAPVDRLADVYGQALSDPDVVGLAIGTRPDCIDERKLEMIEKVARKRMVWVEYGLQSMHNRTLDRINRGHTFEDFVQAVRITRGRDILICAHVILGLPGESKVDVLETAAALARLGIDGVKIHNLFVVENTAMSRLMDDTDWVPIDRRTYVDWVVDFLERLPAHTVVQRLTGDPDPATLRAPAWALEKQRTLARIHETFHDRNAQQGARFVRV